MIVLKYHDMLTTAIHIVVYVFYVFQSTIFALKVKHLSIRLSILGANPYEIVSKYQQVGGFFTRHYKITVVLG